jgi:hypothetical protein
MVPREHGSCQKITQEPNQRGVMYWLQTVSTVEKERLTNTFPTPDSHIIEQAPPPQLPWKASNCLERCHCPELYICLKLFRSLPLSLPFSFKNKAELTDITEHKERTLTRSSICRVNSMKKLKKFQEERGVSGLTLENEGWTSVKISLPEIHFLWIHQMKHHLAVYSGKENRPSTAKYKFLNHGTGKLIPSLSFH